MARTYDIDGKQITVDDNVDYSSAVRMAAGQGIISQGRANEIIVEPETGGWLDEALIGAGYQFARRSFGAIESDIEPPDTLAASLGGAAPGVATAFLGPATLPAQIALAGGFEALDKDASLGSITGQAALGGAGQAVSNVTQRVLSGMARGGFNFARGKPLTTTVESFAGKQFARTVKGAGGFNRIDDFNQRVINRAAAKAIGVDADKLTPDVLEQGRLFVKGLYNQAYKAVPDGLDTKAAIDVIENIPENVLPRRGKLLENLKAANAQGFKDADTIMRDVAPTLRSSQAAQWADEVDMARDLLRQAAEDAGADLTLLDEAAKRWNIFSDLKEIRGVVQTDDVPAGQLLGKMMRENRKGLTGFATGRSQGVDDVDDLVGVVRLLAGDAVPIGSETFSRAAMFGPAGAAIYGVTSGSLTPEQGAAIAGIGLAPQLLGPAVFGKSLPSLTKLGAGASAEGGAMLIDRLRDE